MSAMRSWRSLRRAWPDLTAAGHGRKGRTISPENFRPWTCLPGFAGALAHTLEKRGRLLKLLSMNHYDMEAADVNYVCLSVYEIVESVVKKLLGEKEG